MQNSIGWIDGSSLESFHNFDFNTIFEPRMTAGCAFLPNATKFDVIFSLGDIYIGQRKKTSTIAFLCASPNDKDVQIRSKLKRKVHEFGRRQDGDFLVQFEWKNSSSGTIPALVFDFNDTNIEITFVRVLINVRYFCFFMHFAWVLILFDFLFAEAMGNNIPQ